MEYCVCITCLCESVRKIHLVIPSTDTLGEPNVVCATNRTYQHAHETNKELTKNNKHCKKSVIKKILLDILAQTIE